MHSSFLFFVRSHPEQVASTPFAFLLADRRAHAWYIQFMAWWHCYCAFPLPLVVHLRFLPRRPSNELSCLILIMCRHCARLSLIVPFRMLFMDRYFTVHRAVEALLNASTWPGYGLQVGTAEAAHRTQQKRRMIELFQRSSRPMLSMCSEERNFECPGGLWRPGIGFFALLASH